MRIPFRKTFDAQNHDYLIIVLVYVVAHGLIFLNTGLFWDDWSLFDNTAHILDTFWQLGAPAIGYIHTSILSFTQSLLIYRSIVFISYLLSALLLNDVLKTIREIDPLSRVFLVLFFAVFPVNSARIAIVIVPSTLYYFMFFLSFWMVSRFTRKRNLFWRVASLLGFYISFSHNAFLVFYAIILLYLAYLSSPRIDSYRALMSWVIRNVDFCLLPVVFWTVRGIFFTPNGIYSHYNAVNFKGILFALKFLLIGFYTSFLEVSLISFETLTFSAVICGVFFAAIIVRLNISGPVPNAPSSLALLSAGVFSFLLAIFPYLVVHSLPHLYDWGSRHQRLVPLGAAFILYYVFKILMDKLKIRLTHQIIAFSIAVFGFVATDVSTYLAFQKDWYKQLSIIENFRSSDVMRNHSFFVFTDHTLDLNVNRREYRSFEYCGLMKCAFGDESRFGINAREKRDIEDYRIQADRGGNYKQFNWDRHPEFNVLIRQGDYAVDTGRLIRLMFRERFTKTEFRENVAKIVKLEIASITDPLLTKPRASCFSN
ncbi:MAG: hypothetical protein C4576_24670 [Desulfobacteraceae bacterium]|nr:MAG: hypothetical protein C4576_24670 [Desulfobacteraceae bacterium]